MVSQSRHEMLVLLVGIALALFLFATFNSPTVQEQLRPHSLFANPSGAADGTAFNTGILQIKVFLNRTQEAMGMYLMLIFGLKVEKATR